MDRTTSGGADFRSELRGNRFVIGDWNGDGIDSVGVFRPTNTTVYLRNLNTTGAHGISYMFGQPTWLPTAGIWY